MAGSLNSVQLIGHLGADPEVRNLQSGKSVCNLRIATSQSWLQDGERKEKTEWHSVVIWGPLGDVAAKYARKGSKLYVKGQLQTRKWQDKDGGDRYSTEVVLQGFGAELILLDGKKQDDADRGETQTRARPQAPAMAGRDFDDDIPF